MSTKHHVICKSKTLDVPIIITNDYDTAANNTNSNNVDSPTSPPSNQNSMVPNATTITATLPSSVANSNKFQKGYSLDSHALYNQNSLSSSSSLINDLTSSSNSISSSSNSIQHRQFLLPPSSLNSSQAQNINADFETSTLSSIYERFPLPTRKMLSNEIVVDSSGNNVNSNNGQEVNISY